MNARQEIRAGLRSITGGGAVVTLVTALDSGTFDFTGVYVAGLCGVAVMIFLARLGLVRRSFAAALKAGAFLAIATLAVPGLVLYPAPTLTAAVILMALRAWRAARRRSGMATTSSGDDARPTRPVVVADAC